MINGVRWYLTSHHATSGYCPKSPPTVTDDDSCFIGENAISFDLFVQSCISLKRMTDVFKKYDDDRDG